MDYLRTTKPRVVLLFVVAALAAYLLAGGTQTPAVLALIVGLGAAVGGAGALNNYLERERDRQMERTRERALPAGRVPPGRVLALGFGLIAAGVALLGIVFGAAAAGAAAAGAAYYLIAYTLLLKPRFAHSAVPGGVAGLFPPLTGWAAGAAVASEPASGLLLLYLLAVVFLWSPPHFWALTLVRSEEYRAAGVPVPPTGSGEALTRLQMLSYTVCLVGLSLLPVATGLLGVPYLLAAGIAGLAFAGLVVRTIVRPGPAADHAVYKLSGPYLAVLLGAMVLDGAPAVDGLVASGLTAFGHGSAGVGAAGAGAFALGAFRVGALDSGVLRLFQ